MSILVRDSKRQELAPCTATLRPSADVWQLHVVEGQFACCTGWSQSSDQISQRGDTFTVFQLSTQSGSSSLFLWEAERHASACTQPSPLAFGLHDDIYEAKHLCSTASCCILISVQPLKVQLHPPRTFKGLKQLEESQIKNCSTFLCTKGYSHELKSWLKT